MTKKYTLFISDIHLNPNHPESMEGFLALLEDNWLKKADRLYILGDLFDVWLGDDDNSTFAHRIRSALLTASQCCPLFFMHGNRDFLVHSDFANQTRLTLLKDPTCIDLYQKPTLLMHGDQLCTDDRSYQEARRRFTSADFQDHILKKPLWYRRLLARIYRFRSRRHQQSLATQIMDVNQETTHQLMREYGVTQLIHGHTHRPGIHCFQTNQGIYKRITLSDWESKPHALIYYEDHTHVLNHLGLVFPS